MMVRVSARFAVALLAGAALAASSQAATPGTLSVAPMEAATVRFAAAGWVPKARSTYAVQYDGKLDLNVDADAFDLDGFDTRPAVVAALHNANRHAVCYIDVGTWEKWRPDAGKFPASVLGKPDGGWPGERWLDIRQRAVLEPIMRARFQICQRKGFDAVDPENIDGYQNRTGFPLRANQQLAYDRWVARAVHALGLAVAQKNDPAQVGQLAGNFDFAVVEQCDKYAFCDRFARYASRGALAVDIEYDMPRKEFQERTCPKTRGDGETALLKHLRLDAWVIVCSN
ncbi:MAG TPA: endo alpha-1,4 polygalactosaminidase [Candidatus Tumulicola sp.]|jgi:hypothetical protein